MKFLLQEPVVRGKQIQIPILGERYKTSSGWRHGGGGWIDLNVCANRNDKMGNALAEEIAYILRKHGYEFDYETRWEKLRREGKKPKAKK